MRFRAGVPRRWKMRRVAARGGLEPSPVATELAQRYAGGPDGDALEVGRDELGESRERSQAGINC